MIDFMNEELLTDVDKLPMDNPRIELMIEDLMTAEQDLRKHILDDGITTSALLVESIEYLTTSLGLFFDFIHEVQKCGKHLKVDAEFLLEGEDSE